MIVKRLQTDRRGIAKREQRYCKEIDGQETARRMFKKTVKRK